MNPRASGLGACLVRFTFRVQVLLCMSSSQQVFATPDLQVQRGAYIGNAFVKDEDAHQFFEMCQQAGGPRLLPSKRDRHNFSNSESGRESPGASAPKSTSKEVDHSEIDPNDNEAQVCGNNMCAGPIFAGSSVPYC